MELLLETDQKNLEKILEAEKLLREAGIEFDTGMPIDGSPKSVREWFFDGTGKGYEVRK